MNDDQIKATWPNDTVSDAAIDLVLAFKAHGALEVPARRLELALQSAAPEKLKKKCDEAARYQAAMGLAK